jgi:glutathione peroxidase-family protein
MLCRPPCQPSDNPHPSTSIAMPNTAALSRACVTALLALTTLSVRGTGAHPFFVQLAQATDQATDWNFAKYRLGRDGRPTVHFDSREAPDGASLLAAIERAPAAPR